MNIKTKYIRSVFELINATRTCNYNNYYKHKYIWVNVSLVSDEVDGHVAPQVSRQIITLPAGVKRAHSGGEGNVQFRVGGCKANDDLA